MKVLVSVKRAIDYNVRIQIKPDGSGVVTDGVKHNMNPFDEIAVEQGVRWKEAGTIDELVAVTIGPDACAEQLRTALAFGCDRAIHVRTNEAIQPLTAARILQAIVRQEAPDVLLMGKQSIDDDNSQTGQMTAGLLDWPQATFASAIELNAATARVTREIDAGLETLDIDLPAVITVDLRLNDPRYLKLPNIMKAKKKPIEATDMATLGVTPAAPLTISQTTPPATRPAGMMVDTPAQLISTLKDKGLL